MTILRLEVSADGVSNAWLYIDGLGQCFIADSMKCLADIVTEADSKAWQEINGVYVYRGPAGFSRLRAIHSFAKGLSVKNNIPIAGYKMWEEKYGNTVPKPEESISIIYPS